MALPRLPPREQQQRTSGALATCSSAARPQPRRRMAAHTCSRALRRAGLGRGLGCSSLVAAAPVLRGARLAPGAALPPSAALATPQRAAPADDATALPIRVVGVGARTFGALASLAAQQDFPAEAWCLESDPKALEKAPTSNAVLVRAPKGGVERVEDVLDSEDLARVVGPVFMADGSLGCGVTFLLASAGDGARPGGVDDAAVVELARALREAGHFTVAVLTRPFEFEGAKRGAAAAAMLEQLQQVAHMTVSVDQDVLNSDSNAGGLAMTAAEAMTIADRALEHAVRCVAMAVRVPELLVVSAGAAAWHAKARGNLRRRMSPPLQQVLTSPGMAALGRGQAVVSVAAAARMGTKDALQCLAADAVRAAAESPFLEGALPSASGLVCCISLPASYAASLEAAGLGGSATRLAAQAGGGVLVDLVGGGSGGGAGTGPGGVGRYVLLCAQPAAAGPADESGEIRVEATLLLMRPTPGAGADVKTKVQVAGGGAGQPMLRAAQRGGPAGRLPPSAWSAMSALAGGTGRAAPAAAPAPQTPPAAPAKANGAPRVASPFGGAVPAANGGARGAGAVATPQQAQQQRAQPVQAAAVRAPPAPSQAPARPAQQAEPSTSNVGDELVDSLTAQSLDLPPAAAKWRQTIRRRASGSSALVVTAEVAEGEEEGEGFSDEDEAGAGAGLFGFGRRKREVSVVDRAASMLHKDRSDSGWDGE